MMSEYTEHLYDEAWSELVHFLLLMRNEEQDTQHDDNDDEELVA